MLYFTDEAIYEENPNFETFERFALENYTRIFFSYSNTKNGMGKKLAEFCGVG